MQLETLPPFNLSEHYRELSHVEGNNRYRFVTLDEIEIKFKNSLIPKGKKILFLDNKDKLWMTITQYSIIIEGGYAWNGCSPKKWWGLWWGTPDFQPTIIASLVHDALRQFEGTVDFPFTRNQENLIFKNILHENEFVLEGVYYNGVELGDVILPRKKYDVKSLTISFRD